MLYASRKMWPRFCHSGRLDLRKTSRWRRGNPKCDIFKMKLGRNFCWILCCIVDARAKERRTFLCVLISLENFRPVIASYFHLNSIFTKMSKPISNIFCCNWMTHVLRGQFSANLATFLQDSLLLKKCNDDKTANHLAVLLMMSSSQVQIAKDIIKRSLEDEE